MNHFILFNNRAELVLTDTSDGNMKVVPSMEPDAAAQARQNRLRAVNAIALPDDTTALVRVTYEQEDFCKFVVLDSAEHYALTHDLQVAYSDGILTSIPELGILLPLADCLGIVLYDTQHHALMVVHCGRHTLLQAGARKAVQFMKEQVHADPRNIHAWFSPCAGKDEYPLFEADNKGLAEFAREQLIQAGLSASSIQLSPFETTTSPDYYSHSQGDTENRFAICAKLRALL